MRHRKLTVGVTALAFAVGGTGAGVAAGAAAPKQTSIKAVTSFKVKINRYVRDGLRWNKDVYTVRSGGTLRIVNNAPDEGPHTFTVLKRKDMPGAKQVIRNKCKICDTLGQAHGADPNSEAPPKFAYLDNGKGSTTAPNIDAAGDSAFVGPNKGDSVALKVTAKKGTTLHFICLIHQWMQGRVRVR